MNLFICLDFPQKKAIGRGENPVPSSLFGFEKEKKSFEQNSEVQQKGPVFYIIEVVLEFFVAILQASGVLHKFYLRPACKAWLYNVAQVIMGNFFF